MPKINIRQLSVQICDEFENLLEKYNIYIPDRLEYIYICRKANV